MRPISLLMPRMKSAHVDSPAAVGARIREARERAGISQRALAFQGCSVSYISRIEAGDRIPSLQVLREIGRRLRVDSNWLATGHKGLSFETALSLAGAYMAIAGYGERAVLRYHQALSIADTAAEQERALSGLIGALLAAGRPLEALTEIEANEVEAARERPGEHLELLTALIRAMLDASRPEEAGALIVGPLANVMEIVDSGELVEIAIAWFRSRSVDDGSHDTSGAPDGIEDRESDDARTRAVIAHALDHATELRHPDAVVRRHARLAEGHTNSGEHELAGYHARVALRVSRDGQRQLALAQLLAAEDAVERGETTTALSRLEQLHESAGVLTEEQCRRAALARLKTLVALDEQDEAVSLARSLASELKGIDDAAPEFRLVRELAGILHLLGESAAAERLYRHALERAESSPVGNRLVRSLRAGLADLLAEAGETDEALGLLKQALEETETSVSTRVRASLA